MFKLYARRILTTLGFIFMVDLVLVLIVVAFPLLPIFGMWYGLLVMLGVKDVTRGVRRILSSTGHYLAVTFEWLAGQMSYGVKPAQPIEYINGA